ncbi:rab-GTPase-TBC domain-containing protein, partial [Coemansia spiralis]
ILPVNMFRSPMDAVQSDQLVLEKLVCRRLPQLSAHMQTDLGGVAPLAPVTVSWFLTLFFDCLPEPHRLRVWDMLFAHGYPIVFQTCLAILELNQEALLQCKTPVAFYAMLQ